MAAGSSTPTSIPRVVVSGPRIPSAPPDFVATTGRPDASASTRTTPNVSRRLAWTNTSARAIAAATPLRSAGGSNDTASATSSSTARACQRASSASVGDRPISRSERSGRSRRASANASSRVAIPLPAFRVPTYRSSPGRRSPCAPGAKRSTGTAFGTTTRRSSSSPATSRSPARSSAASASDTTTTFAACRTDAAYRRRTSGSPSSSAVRDECSVMRNGTPSDRATAAASTPSGKPVWACTRSNGGDPPERAASPSMNGTIAARWSSASRVGVSSGPVGTGSRATGTLTRWGHVPVTAGVPPSVRASERSCTAVAARPATASRSDSRRSATRFSRTNSNDATVASIRPVATRASTWSATNEPRTGSSMAGYQRAMTRVRIGDIRRSLRRWPCSASRRTRPRHASRASSCTEALVSGRAATSGVTTVPPARPEDDRTPSRSPLHWHR